MSFQSPTHASPAPSPPSPLFALDNGDSPYALCCCFPWLCGGQPGSSLSPPPSPPDEDGSEGPSLSDIAQQVEQAENELKTFWAGCALWEEMVHDDPALTYETFATVLAEVLGSAVTYSLQSRIRICSIHRSQ